MLSQKPDWLRVRLPGGAHYRELKSRLRDRNLHTVCEEAHCPNLAECWDGGTATIMLMGDTCTRGCRFCSVKTGNPRGVLDPFEPAHVAQTVARSGWRYVVLTSVDRDDLPDGGAAHFAATVRAIKGHDPTIMVEALVPDFRGDPEAVRIVVEAGPEVFAQNQETVERLTHPVRDMRSGYAQTLRVLRTAKAISPSVYTKSSLMLGLGEREEEVLQAMRDLRVVGVDILTLGQYLRPSTRHIEMARWVAPEEFEFYQREGQELGFLYVASGPLVRSSYRAGEFFLENVVREQTPVPVGG